MNEHDRHPDLTPEEEEALQRLPRHRMPSQDLEDSVVAALKDEGLLVGTRVRASRISRGWLAAAVAAGLTLFASGVATGQWLAGNQAAELVGQMMDDDALSRAARVQETGSEYVRAVAGLSEVAGENSAEAASSGREAAQAALHAAVLELVRLNPEDETMQLVLAVLTERLREGVPSDGLASRRSIWF